MEVNKEAFLYGTIFCVSNLYQQSLRKPLTFSLFSSNSPKVFPCLTVSKIYIFFFLAETTEGFFSSFFTYFNLYWVAQPYLETNSHLHLYRKMHCMERIFISCRFFLIQFWWVLQRQASSYTTVIAALFSCLWSEWEMTVADACGKHSSEAQTQ